MNISEREISSNIFHIPKFQYGELPSYIDYMIGYSYEHKAMYFADKSGATIASKDGNRFIIMESDFVLPGDVDKPLPISGKGSAQLSPVEIPGGFKADFYGISYKVHNYSKSYLQVIFVYQGAKIVSWARCCGS